MTPARLSYDDAVRKLRSEIDAGQCSFIARVGSPWIVLGFEAWLHRHGAGRTGCLLVAPSTLNSDPYFSSTSLVADPRVAISISKPRTSRAQFVTNLRRSAQLPYAAALLAHMASSGPPLDIVSARHADLGFMLDVAKPLLRREVRIHLVDEGFGDLAVRLGTHVGPVLNNARRRSGGNPLRYAAVLAMARGRGLSAKLVAHQLPIIEHNLIHWDPLTQRTRVDNEMLRSYRAAIRRRERITVERRTDDVRIAVFATHPVSDFMNASPEVEATIANQVVEKLLAKGFDVLIKPHPEERPAKYGELARKHGPRVRPLASTIPSEQLFLGLRPEDVVVGYTGQSLLSAHLLFELAAYSVTSILTGVDFNETQLRDYRSYERTLPIGSIRQLAEVLDA